VALYQPESEAVEDLIAARCRAVGASLRVADFDELETVSDGRSGQVFRYCDGPPLRLPLLGDHQQRNAAVVLEAVELLRERGWAISDAALEAGLAATVWPGRLELADRLPFFVIDGGHNPQCASALAANWDYYFPSGRKVLLLGMLADKDVPGFLAQLAPLADTVVCTAPDSDRALPPAELAALLRPYGKPVLLCPDPAEAVDCARRAAGLEGSVLACGSLYLAGALRTALGMEGPT
jgi:dihydrofolate synthase/folylpolyglutamate synthase